MLENDDSLGVLDDLAVIRGALEGAMSAEAALRRTEDQLHDVRAALERMASSVRDREHFPEADVDFHFLVMTLSGNQLAATSRGSFSSMHGRRYGSLPIRRQRPTS